MHMKCKIKDCNNEATKNPYQKGLFCSSRCALRAVRTRKHQKLAARAATLVIISRYRGTGNGYIKEFNRHQHRVVMERVLGRKLKKGEIVHHVDGNKKNNHPSNLQVMTQADHARLHGKMGGINSVKKMIIKNTKYGPLCRKAFCPLPNIIGRPYCSHHQYRFVTYNEI